MALGAGGVATPASGIPLPVKAPVAVSANSVVVVITSPATGVEPRAPPTVPCPDAPATCEPISLLTVLLAPTGAAVVVLDASVFPPLAVPLTGPAAAAPPFDATPRVPPNAPTPSPGSGSPVPLFEAAPTVVFIAKKPAPDAIPPGVVPDGTMATAGVASVCNVDVPAMPIMG